jgi:hypothetical protein
VRPATPDQLRLINLLEERRLRAGLESRRSGDGFDDHRLISVYRDVLHDDLLLATPSMVVEPFGQHQNRSRELRTVSTGAFNRLGQIAADCIFNYRLRGSKTDQEREGATMAIPRGDIACPVKALRAWLDAAGIEAGPIFARSTRPHGVALAAYVSIRR